LLASDTDFEQHFSDALARHARVDAPFELARTHLAFGERLRRARRPAEARKHLRAAVEALERLGAAPWAARARAELEATGERRRRERPAGIAEELTPQELHVALLVARGATTKEAAASLFLSPRTIDAHLYRIYRKLGVRSRSELTRVVIEERADARE
jgi:DNA-binding NarL/FixJ family response regulator